MARYHEGSGERAAARQAADKIGNRQRYSLYMPVTSKSHRKASVSKPEDKAKKERDALISRASVDPTTAGRRRATMRSKEHDDEEEQLLRALEESKREVESAAPSGRRNGKRGRDDSDE